MTGDGAISKRDFYSALKWMHDFKFRRMVCPNGPVSSLTGPFNGKDSDMSLDEESDITDYLRELNIDPPPV